MSQLIKVGDLVNTRISHHPPKMIYGNIIEIKDSDGEIYDEYNVITGHGDKNSKLEVTVNYFAELDEDFHFDITDNIKYLETPLIKVEKNMHNLYFHTEKSLKSTYKIYKDKLEKINNKMYFLKKHRNIIEQRNEKLKKVLDEETR